MPGTIDKDGQERSATVLYAVLWPHKSSIQQRWVDAVHGTYPFNTIGFLHTNKDRFANPVGYRTEEAAKKLLDVVFTAEPDKEEVSQAIEEIMRVRAIQDFSPEEATGIFFVLKDIVRQVVEQSGQASQCQSGLWALESRVDAVVLMAFGIYARCRERLHQLRVEEFKREHSQMLRLALRKAGVKHIPAEAGETPAS